MTGNSQVSIDTGVYYDKFYNYLNELYKSYIKLSELLTKKLAAIAKFDMAALDSIIKEEQVFVMLSRGFDSNIQTYRQKLSLTGNSLSAVISEMPPEQQSRFNLLFIEFRSKLDEVKFLNQKCQSLIEDRIYSIERSINHLDKTKNTTYDKPGAAPKPVSGADGQILKKSV